MKKILNWISKNREIVFKSIYSIPIFLSIIVSINHCYTWLLISNENVWAWYVSISIEVVALTTLVALILGKITPSILFTFVLITSVQIIGNVFYSFNYIDDNGNLFLNWKSFVDIVFEDNEMTLDKYKFWLAAVQGSVVPMLSLLSLHLISNYKLKDTQTNTDSIVHNEVIKEVTIEKPVEIIKEIEKEVIKEIPVIVEKPVEVIKEVERETPIIKRILPRKTPKPVELETKIPEIINEDLETIELSENNTEKVFYEDMGKPPSITNKPRRTVLPQVKIRNKK